MHTAGVVVIRRSSCWPRGQEFLADPASVLRPRGRSGKSGNSLCHKNVVGGLVAKSPGLVSRHLTSTSCSETDGMTSGESLSPVSLICKTEMIGRLCLWVE